MHRMKTLAFFTYLLLLTNLTFAQKDSLAFDNKGKYIYYKIVNSGNNNADAAYKKSIAFVKDMGKDTKLLFEDDNKTALGGSGLFVVYKPSLAKHPDGQIAYLFNIEVKGDKYRYWLTNFAYTPYYRDRYNNYVPKNGIETPLEKKSANVSDKDKSQYLNDCATYAKQFGENLKAYLNKSNIPAAKKDTTRKVTLIDKW